MKASHAARALPARRACNSRADTHLARVRVRVRVRVKVRVRVRVRVTARGRAWVEVGFR